MQELILPAKTIVKFNGYPFELLEDTKVMGMEENLKLAYEQMESSN